MKGESPVVQFCFNWDHVSVIAGMHFTGVCFNPVEYLWAWLKRHALANFCPDTLAELQHTARAKLKSGQRRSAIIASCWAQAELF